MEPVEQIQLALAGKDLVVPLDMLQNRGADALSGCSDDVVCGETRRQPVGLGESELPDHRPPQPGSEADADRESIPGSRGHAKKATF